MKKPSWKMLVVLFLVGLCFTTLAFAAYHIGLAKIPAVKAFFESSALDTNSITAYFTALAFVGFLLTSVYQAYCNAATEQELEKEKARNTKLQHDSLWLTIQIARLHTFSELKDLENLKKTMREIEDHWGRLSPWINDDNK
jgi:Serpentine type 7TM GPCR chemoreceptor Srv